MAGLFHQVAPMSIAARSSKSWRLAAGAALLGAMVITAWPAPLNAQSETGSSVPGRWTVVGRQAFSARALPYKTVDIAACGNSFCAVSVSDAGDCGSVLFRFARTLTGRGGSLRGHGLWGAERKRLTVDATGPSSDGSGPRLFLYLGDSWDVGARSRSMPRFDGNYRRTGDATCRVPS